MSQSPDPYFDHAATSVKEAAENGADAAASAVESAGDSIKQAADESKNAVEETIDDAADGDSAKTKTQQIIESLSHEADKVKACASSAAKRVATEAERAAGEAKDLAKKTADNINEEFKDPAVSTTVLFTVLTASAASTYLSQQHKQGALTPLVATVVVLGTAAVAFAEYWGVKAYFDRKSQ